MNCKNYSRIVFVFLVLALLIASISIAEELSVRSSPDTPGSSSVGDSSGSDSSGSGSNSDSSSGSSRSSDSTAIVSESGGSSRSGGISSVSTESESKEEEKEEKSPAEIKKERIEQRKEKQKIEDIEYVKTRLKVSEEKEISEKTVERLIKSRSEDYDNFKRITSIVTESVKTDNDKEILSNELARMDNNFIKEFQRRFEISKPEVKRQIDDYLNLVKSEETVKVEIKSKQIEDLFSQKMDIDSFIDEIWD